MQQPTAGKRLNSPFVFQVVKGLKYIVDLRLSRTVCKKEAAAVNLTSCDFQPAGPLRMVSASRWRPLAELQV